MQRNGVVAAAGIGIGVLFFQARRDRVDFGARVFDVDVIFQPANKAKKMGAAIFHRIGHQRLKRIKIFASDPDGIMKSGRHYADHSVRAKRKQNFPADDVPVGIELALPSFVGQDDNTRIGGLFFTGKCTTEKRPHRQDPKNIRCDSQTFELARFVTRSQNRARAGVGKH